MPHTEGMEQHIEAVLTVKGHGRSVHHDVRGMGASQVFGPAFRRNSRWSVQTPVPEVGDEGTPFQQVDKFYDFWFSFKSWREFPHPDEEDVEQAECREEKR